MSIRCEIIDYNNPQQAADLVMLVNAYAVEPTGGGEALPQYVKDSLASELAKRDFAFTIIAYVDDQPAGVANCFEGFSTFKAKPLINIHDIAVLKSFRGQKIATRLLEKIEEVARSRHCCKITLEVLEKNQIAKAAYIKFGFEGYELDPEMGKALFWAKPLLDEE
ncbi:GNAT family N-acetyltransferase [Aliikangiella maris]|uniref:GNAT family N-acetyltransferase n=2 Tax=Aliikangiella maris TaxID=3162458 RepID=A0ABV2BZB6_9GAMM